MLRPFLLASWLLIFTWSVGMIGMSRTLQGSLFGSQRMPAMAVILMLCAMISLTLCRVVVPRGLKWLT
ncbi:hypothetical protein [Aureimonas sp. AU20]|uniref:hypothetical protein n=1 Tax=Aureimonas sp. AU20 TaxID=1349819 RepID=UPI00071F27C3|nr:hypothetical protein [Aureimonas sp. AU20]ALN75416.1 hypothetical protein M673_22005 [Aureimonas sp. AU20]